MGVALITVAMFAGKRLLDEHDRLIQQVGILGNRVVALEFEVRSLEVAVNQRAITPARPPKMQ